MLTAEKQNSGQEMHTLYHDHHGWLYRWLRKKLDCSVLAADLVHDVFVRLLTRPGDPAIREPRAYMCRIAQGLLVDFWRRRELERAWLDTLALFTAAEAPSAEEQAQIIEMLALIDAMLQQLSPRVREVFLLAQFEELTCPQIAARLGISRATVERDLAKALQQCYKVRFAADTV